jgi:hypothetical protein
VIIEVTRQALKQTLAVLRHVRWTDWRWLTLLLVLFTLSFVIADDRLFIVDGTIGLSLAATVVALFFTAIWFATRLLGDPERRHAGAVLPWLGWSLFAIALTAPLILFADGFMWFGPGEAMDAGFWASSVFYLILFSLTAPLVLRGTSAAVNRDVVWATQLHPFWSKNLPSLIFGYLAIQAPAWLIGEGVDGVITFGAIDETIRPMLLILSAALSTTLSIIGTAYLVACVQLALAHHEATVLPPEAQLS